MISSVYHQLITLCSLVLDTYGFCGFDVLTPFADGGTLSSKLHLWQRGKIKLSKKSRLHLAFEVAAGLAAVHDIDGEGLSSVAHGDLKVRCVSITASLSHRQST